MLYTQPLYIGLGIAGGIGILGSLFVPGPDKSLNRMLVWVAAICCYLMWMMVYVSQMNPLLLPVDTRYAEDDFYVNETQGEAARVAAAKHWNDHNGEN